MNFRCCGMTRYIRFIQLIPIKACTEPGFFRSRGAPTAEGGPAGNENIEPSRSADVNGLCDRSVIYQILVQAVAMRR
jgi:hypothetical protein